MKIILLAGPSGSGKDTLLRAARNHFQSNKNLHFARRYITRPPDINEDNYFIDHQGFLILKQARFFISSWKAHNQLYGIADPLFQGVTANTMFCSVSRSAVEDFEVRYNDVTTILVTVKKDVLKHRLQARGRENNLEIKKRLERAHKPVLARKLNIFENSNSLNQSVADFNALLERLVSKTTCRVS